MTRVQDVATVCIPRRDTPDRIDAHQRCHEFWTGHGFTVVTGDREGQFSCSAARNIAVAKADTEVVIVADADTVVDDIDQIDLAVGLVANGHADLVYPFSEFRHIDKKWALQGDYTRAPAQRVYPDSPGGIFVLTKAALERFGGFDERFVAGLSDNGSCFGFDDTAFRIVAQTLGDVRRVRGIAWSFNHAVDRRGQPARDFSARNPNRFRFRRYQAAAGDPDRIRELISCPS